MRTYQTVLARSVRVRRSPVAILKPVPCGVCLADIAETNNEPRFAISARTSRSAELALKFWLDYSLKRRRLVIMRIKHIITSNQSCGNLLKNSIDIALSAPIE